jgi:putative zinc finger protein
MDCREFRSKHVAYVDDLLAAVDMEGMRAHLGRCPSCARQDTAVRRSLMLVHNLPSIEPSADFMVRLNARLTEIGPPPRYAPRNSLFFSMPAMGTFAAVAAGIGVVVVLSMRTAHYVAPTQMASAPAPVSATVDSFPDLTFTAIAAPEVTPLANAAYVAAVPTGIPIWPAVLMAGEAPVRFASMELQQSEGR